MSAVGGSADADVAMAGSGSQGAGLGAAGGAGASSSHDVSMTPVSSDITLHSVTSGAAISTRPAGGGVPPHPSLHAGAAGSGAMAGAGSSSSSNGVPDGDASMLPAGSSSKVVHAPAMPMTASSSAAGTTTTSPTATAGAGTGAGAGGEGEAGAGVGAGTSTGDNGGHGAPATVSAVDDLLKFLHSHRCYDVLPDSGKVVVFEYDVPAKLAFYALVEHDVREAPVWNSEKEGFVGMFTATDIISLMRYYHAAGKPQDTFVEHTIHSWRAASQRVLVRPAELVWAHPEATLFDAVNALRNSGTGSLAVYDPDQKAVLGLLQHHHIFQFLAHNFRGEVGDVVHKTPHELGIGIYDAAVAVRDSTPLVKVFDALFEFKLKALPIVDADNVVVNVYHRGEVVYLARDPMLHRLDGSVADAIAAQKRDGVLTFESLVTCSRSESLLNVLGLFAKAKARHIVFVDEHGKFAGFCPLTDVLHFFLHPLSGAADTAAGAGAGAGSGAGDGSGSSGSGGGGRGGDGGGGGGGSGGVGAAAATATAATTVHTDDGGGVVVGGVDSASAGNVSMSSLGGAAGDAQAQAPAPAGATSPHLDGPP